MGLLKRARSLQGASRSSRSVQKGLLHKSLAIIDKLFPNQEPGSSAVVQEELDIPAAEAIPSIPVTDGKKTPESVPRTWKETGRAAPVEEDSPERKERSEAERHELLLAGLGEIDDGIEAPGRLFSLAKDHLGLSRAALLLYDPVHLVFAPWAAHGFDQTTNRRLRIPLGANDIMNRLASGKVFLLSSAEEMLPFHQYFSFRELATLSALLLVPFIHESKFMGLLLIGEMDTSPGQSSLEIFKTLADRAAGLIYRAREKHLEGAKRGIPEKPESLRESVRTALQATLEQGIAPLMIRIDTGKLIESVIQNNPYIDPFRLSQDISRVVLSLFQSLGSVFQVDRDRVLLVVARRSERMSNPDPELLVYHLRATLMRLLPELAAREHIDLNAQIRNPGADIEEVLNLLAEIV